MKIRFTEGLTLKTLSPGRESPKVHRNCWTESLSEPTCRKRRAQRCGRIHVSWMWFVWVLAESWGNRGTELAWCLSDSRAHLSPVQQWNILRSVVLKPEQPVDWRIRCVCSSALILNRLDHCLCGGIVFKANCVCFWLISKESVCQEFNAIYAAKVNPHKDHES